MKAKGPDRARSPDGGPGLQPCARHPILGVIYGAWLWGLGIWVHIWLCQSFAVCPCAGSLTSLSLGGSHTQCSACRGRECSVIGASFTSWFLLDQPSCMACTGHSGQERAPLICADHHVTLSLFLWNTEVHTAGAWRVSVPSLPPWLLHFQSTSKFQGKPACLCMAVRAWLCVRA